MHIHEAIAASKDFKHNGPHVRRKSWGLKTAYIIPTDGPDLCMVCSKLGIRSWTPSASDLLADDWETCFLDNR